MLDADPLADIRNLRKVSAVYRDGQSIDRERLPETRVLVAGAGTAAAFRNPAARALIERRFPLKDEPATCYALWVLAGLDLSELLLAFVVLISSLTFHEAAHAWTADRLGDSTARMLGRLSLNPAVHVDLIGTIVFPLLALVDRRTAARLGQAGAGEHEQPPAAAARFCHRRAGRPGQQPDPCRCGRDPRQHAVRLGGGGSG